MVKGQRNYIYGGNSKDLFPPPKTMVQNYTKQYLFLKYISPERENNKMVEKVTSGNSIKSLNIKLKPL